MTLKTDIPAWLLHMFMLSDGSPTGVRWVTEDEYAHLDDIPGMPKRGTRIKPNGVVRRYKHSRRLPWGQNTGGRDVHGHGQLTLCSGRHLLTADILDAIRNGWYWLWDTRPRKPSSVHPSANDLAACVLIHNTWYMTGEELHWLVKPHPDIDAGSVVKGMELAGRGDRVVQRKARYYVTTDIEHVLRHGRLPWMQDWE